MKQVTATVISNGEVMPGVHLIWLESPQIASIAQPGQFIMVRCGEGFKHPLRRPLSIHQLADGSNLAFLFNVAGKGTHWLSQCQTGDNIDLLGPLGKGYSIHPESHNLLLVAGGIGIAPLYFLARDLVKRGYKVLLLYGTADSKRYPISSEIEMVAATEDGAVGHKGPITDLLPEYIDRADQIFACGPMLMYRDMAHRKQELKLEGKPVQVSLEVRMGCGRGVCYGCTLKTKRGLKQVCQDGPVFDLDDILWDELAY